MQSTAFYARSMGTCRIPIIWETARNKIWMELQKGKNMQCNCNEHASRKPDASCPQLSLKITNLEKFNKKLKCTRKSTSVSISEIATTPIHHEVMGPVALGN